MPTRYRLLLPIAVALLAIGLAAFTGYRAMHEPVTSPRSTPVQQEATTSSAVPSAPTIRPASAQSGSGVIPPKSDNAATTTAFSAFATLSVGSTTYALPIDHEETVEAAMADLTKTNSSFTYVQKQYPSLGMFVETINGKSNGDEHYWFLYVNGVQSSTGISSTIVHKGDHIEWRYEH